MHKNKHEKLMKNTLLIILSTAFLIGCYSTEKLIVSNDITADELKQHVRYLASDELQGRMSGTAENRLAAEYIASQFKIYGLKPGGDNATFFQKFKFVSEIKPGENNKLNVNIENTIINFSVDIDYRPMAFTSDTSVTGNFIFAGYGISADTLNYDDYAGIDVTDKIVMILHHTPEGKNPKSGFANYEPLQRKVMTARSKGAKGIIFVKGPLDETQLELVPLRQERGMGNSGMAVMSFRRDAADSLFKLIGKDFLEIQTNINSEKKPNTFEFPNTTINIISDIEKVYSETQNVVGILHGSDPVLKDEHVIIGAHFDHIGFGGIGSGSLKQDTIAIHNGADDNASGTAGLIEIAQYFGSIRNEIKRTYVFIGFSAEELGLLGASHYVKNPHLPLDKATAMINMDMIGRMKDSVFTIQGVGTSPVWNDIIAEQNADSFFTLKLGQDGFGSSDHSVFNSSNIPVLFFFTGLHSDYHKPSDDWQLLNYEGQKLLIDFVVGIIKKLDRIVEKPLYTKVERPAMFGDGAQRGFKVTLGILPDFGDDPNGLKISGARPGTPADKAGLLSGDVIIKFDGKDVKNIYDLTYLLGDYHPGDSVELVLLRDGVKVNLIVTLEARR